MQILVGGGGGKGDKIYAECLISLISWMCENGKKYFMFCNSEKSSGKAHSALSP